MGIEDLHRNPQAAQMADESMVRNLQAQAAVIWPQEAPRLQAYGLPTDAVVLDVACGTGEFTRRAARLFPEMSFTGIDIDEAHLERGRQACAPFGDRVRFESGDAYALAAADTSVDLVVCRHLLQAIPTPALVVGEMFRVTRPGGVAHVIAEDYAMMHFHPMTLDTDRFWLDGPCTFAERTGTDLRSGRAMPITMRSAGFEDVRMDYITIDTDRVDRALFAEIWIAWRDGYTDVIASHTALDPSYLRACFNEMISAIRTGYAVWHLPVVSGRRPS